MDAQPIRTVSNLVAVMECVRVSSDVSCPHKSTAEPCGLALITIAEPSATDAGIASSLCDVLPASALKDVCRFYLGSVTGTLDKCLPGHRAAIIIDTTQNGTAPGTVSIMDLRTMLDRAAIMTINSHHGFSIAAELLALKPYGTLPKRLIFLGVEVKAVDPADNSRIALDVRMPELLNGLSLLVTKVLETLNREK